MVVNGGEEKKEEEHRAGEGGGEVRGERRRRRIVRRCDEVRLRSVISERFGEEYGRVYGSGMVWLNE